MVDMLDDVLHRIPLNQRGPSPRRSRAASEQRRSRSSAKWDTQRDDISSAVDRTLNDTQVVADAWAAQADWPHTAWATTAITDCAASGSATDRRGAHERRHHSARKREAAQ